MAERAPPNPVVGALLRELSVQGQAGDLQHATAYPVKGTIDVLALAEAAQNALGGSTLDNDEAKTPAELNAANDG